MTCAVVLVWVGDDARGEPDRLLHADLTKPSLREVHTSARAYELGTPAFDPASGLVLVPDASSGVVVLELASDGTLVLRETLPLGTALGLPPRHVGVVE